MIKYIALYLIYLAGTMYFATLPLNIAQLVTAAVLTLPGWAAVWFTCRNDKNGKRDECDFGRHV